MILPYIFYMKVEGFGIFECENIVYFTAEYGTVIGDLDLAPIGQYKSNCIL